MLTDWLPLAYRTPLFSWEFHLLLHLLFWSPFAENLALQISDDHLKSAVSKITNSESQILTNRTLAVAGYRHRRQWQIAGVARASSLAIPPFLASAVSTLPSEIHLRILFLPQFYCHLSDSLFIVFRRPTTLSAKQSFPLYGTYLAPNRTRTH